MPIYATPLEYQGDSLVFAESESEFDFSAQTIIDAVEAADDQALETTVRNAINAFVVGCKSDNIWTTLDSGVFRLMAGPRTLAGIFKCGFGADPTNNGFVSGDYVRSTGLKSDGSTKWISANVFNDFLPQDSRHLAVYVTGASTIAGGLIGAHGSPASGRAVLSRTLTGINFRYLSDNLGNRTGEPLGLVGLNRYDASNYNSILNGVIENILQTSKPPTNAMTDVFRVNTVGAVDSRLSYYSVGLSLGVSGLASLDARVTAYMSAISGI